MDLHSHIKSYCTTEKYLLTLAAFFTVEIIILLNNFFSNLKKNYENLMRP